MKKIFLIFTVSLLIAGCATTMKTAEVDDKCKGWAKTVTVSYGDGGITVTPKKTVKQKKPFVIKLDPKSNDWKDKKVIITGKSKKPAECKSESWLNRKYSYNDMKKFRYCAPEIPPEVPADKDCEYKYSVEVVNDLGVRLLFVDPRVEVEH